MHLSQSGMRTATLGQEPRSPPAPPPLFPSAVAQERPREQGKRGVIFSQNSLLASSNLQFMDFLSQRWFLCDKEIISSISKPLKETGVHREEASAGKTCLQAGAASRAFYPSSKLVSRTNSWSLRRKQQVSQDASSWERTAGRWDARWVRAGTGRRRRPPGEVCGRGGNDKVGPKYR